MSNETTPIPQEFLEEIKQAYKYLHYADYKGAFRSGAEWAYRHLSASAPSAGWVERLAYLEALINSPEIDDFLKGAQLEAAHQTERWGIEAEENKMPHHYACVMDKLKGKMAVAIFDGNIEKYKHHLVTLAAVCFNVHRQIDKEGTMIHKYFHQQPSPPTAGSVEQSPK